jgi:hypothetical protein
VGCDRVITGELLEALTDKFNRLLCALHVEESEKKRFQKLYMEL